MPSESTNIGWTDGTWNGIHGCFKISEGCANCYAARDSQRWGHTDHPWTIANAEDNIQMQAHHLDWPENKSPRRIFVNSVSDLFLPEEFLSQEYLYEIFDRMDRYDQHVFQALTKHGTEHDQRLLQWDEETGYWPDNLWMGVTVENDHRIRSSPRRCALADGLTVRPARLAPAKVPGFRSVRLSNRSLALPHVPPDCSFISYTLQ